MLETNVRNFTDEEILSRCTKVSGFKGFPKGYFFIGIQSLEDGFNKFDDKMYLYHNSENTIRFIKVTSCTTNAGITGIQNYERYNSKGVAVIKTDQWYYDLWTYGLHRGKMPALRQVGDILLYRDGNKNNKIEEKGKLYKGKYGINFHTATYGKKAGFFRKLIGGWSVGCQVLNLYDDYMFMLNTVRFQDKISYVLLKES